MKLSLTQENLAAALNVVGRAVSTRSSLPVLGNVLLSTDAKRLKISSTNLEIGINYWLGSKIEKEGAITVPARLFTEFVGNLPAGNLELISDGSNLTVSASHSKAHINGIAADEFPLIPQIKNQATLTLPAETFKEALSQVVVAASLDEARPVLAGVYLYSEDGNLIMVATDSYRLAEKKIKLAKDLEQPLAVIVPARTMQELFRVLEDEGDLSIYLGDNQIMFEYGSVQLTSRLIEGQYPNYRQIIPETTESSFEIGTAEFGRIAKVAGLFARENAGSVRLEVKPEGLVSLISSAPQIGENTSTAECLVKGEGGSVSLNIRYLSDVLSVIKADEVSFAVSGKLNPCLIKPSGKNAPKDYLHIIMPLRT